MRKDMRKTRIYLDYNASAPLLPAAREAMMQALDAHGNPSSIHAEGRAAHRLIEDARAVLAEAVGVGKGQIIFTSGATEAATHALSPIVHIDGKQVRLSRLYAGATEHACIRAGGRFAAASITAIPVDGNGMVEPAALDELLSAHDSGEGAAMVAVQLANNETGVIQPVEEIAGIVRSHNAFFTVDAVQAFGKIPFDMASLGAHFALVTSHKIGGPKGVGALVLADASAAPAPLISGGGQESRHRAGTPNAAAIAGFAAAADEIDANLAKSSQISALRDFIEAGIAAISAEAGNKAGQPVFFAKSAKRLPNTSYFAVPGIKAETAVIALDLAGIAVSSGSACSSGKVSKSQVLEAMGVDDEIARCALRISAGPGTTQAEAGHFVDAWKDIVARAA